MIFPKLMEVYDLHIVTFAKRRDPSENRSRNLHKTLVESPHTSVLLRDMFYMGRE